MCGIVGALSPQGAIEREILAELNRLQHHRGPDDEVLTKEGICWLGNTRLAIQDPTASGNQPFTDPDGRFITVFNGEIYNFHELVARHRLPAKTGCDTEIIPLLWARFGSACLPMLRGMFALAVFDVEEERLFLARDPFGIKPLRWRPYADGILFASEVRPLWRVDRTLPVCDEAVASFLQFCALPADQSPFVGIETVGAGECISFDRTGRPTTEIVVPPLDNPVPGDDHPRTSGALADSLFDSVRHHLISDVPTALLLSAGVDSSVIAYAARELGQTLHCLTVTGVLGEDESAQARATAAEFGHEHENVSTELDGAAISGFFEAMQRPTVDGLNTFLVSRAVASAGYTVALSGLGGDEALGGYSTARMAQLVPLLRLVDLVPEEATMAAVDRLSDRVPRLGSDKVRRLIGHRGPRTARDLIDLQRELFPPPALHDLGFEPRPSAPNLRSASRLGELAAAEVSRYLQPVLLPDADAFSMASSVELRVPFVDRNLFAVGAERRRLRGKRELVSQLDNRYLWLLGKRPKTGFGVPMDEWMDHGPLADVISDAAKPDAPVWSVVDREHGLPILLRHTERWSERWALAVLDGWLRRR